MTAGGDSGRASGSTHRCSELTQCLELESSHVPNCSVLCTVLGYCDRSTALELGCPAALCGLPLGLQTECLASFCLSFFIKRPRVTAVIVTGCRKDAMSCRSTSSQIAVVSGQLIPSSLHPSNKSFVPLTSTGPACHVLGMRGESRWSSPDAQRSAHPLLSIFMSACFLPQCFLGRDGG